MSNIDPRALRRLIDYDPETGVMTWRPRDDPKWDPKWAGKQAFNSRDAYGYRQGQVLSRMMKGHRVAYAMVYGIWPDGQLDHINGIRDDNRICNLRTVTGSENRRNMRPRREGLALGVSQRGQSAWQARIKWGGKDHYLGTFSTYEEACARRKQAERKLGFHVNHGVPVEALLTEGKAVAA